LPPTKHPKIALISGENQTFRLSDENSYMPSMKRFLKPLDIMDAATRSPLNPDFLVLMMPPALLHHSTIGRLSSSIINLLQQRFSVHIKLCSLQEHGIPLEHTTLLLIASPQCDLLPWSMDWPTVDTPPSVKILDVIGDLDFENNQRGGDGYVCSVHNGYTSLGDGLKMLNRHIYNHQTGRAAQSGETFDINATSVSLSHIIPTIHPSKSLRKS
jgi:hypothetical protein